MYERRAVHTILFGQGQVLARNLSQTSVVFGSKPNRRRPALFCHKKIGKFPDFPTVQTPKWGQCFGTHSLLPYYPSPAVYKSTAPIWTVGKSGDTMLARFFQSQDLEISRNFARKKSAGVAASHPEGERGGEVLWLHIRLTRPQGRPSPLRDAGSYTHFRAHETRHDLVCRLLLEKKNV